MAYTIRTAQALALVSAAAEVGIIARFVKDGEFFILQTREEGQKRYSHVFDDSAFEDVASTLQGMINGIKAKVNQASAAPQENPTEKARNELMAKLEAEQKALEALKFSPDSNVYVVQHGGALGLYIGTPTKNKLDGANVVGLPRAMVCTRDYANGLAKRIKNGANVEGKVLHIMQARRVELDQNKALRELLIKSAAK